MSEMRACRLCGGSGKVKCPRCDGYGSMNDKEKSICYYCHGDKVIDCPVCDGSGMVENE